MKLRLRPLPLGLTIASLISMVAFVFLFVGGRTGAAFWFAGIALLCALAAVAASAPSDRKWTATLAVAELLVGIGVTAPLWMPWMLGFLDVHGDRIQSFTDAAQVLFWIFAGIAVLFGLWRPGRDRPAQITVTFDDETLRVADPDSLWAAMGRGRTPVDLRKATETYLAYLVGRYRYLDFRGLGMTDRVALRLPLLG